MIAKYGHAATAIDWQGLPMRVGTFPSQGKVESLDSHSDTVLVWTGSTTEVTIHYGSEDRREGTRRRRFTRHSGMVDLLPRGTVLHDVEWRGGETTCVSASLLDNTMAQLFGEGRSALSVEQGPRFQITDAHVVDLVQRLLVQATAPEPLSDAYVQSLSLALASYVYGTYGVGVSARPEVVGLPAFQAEKLVAYVEDNLERNVSLLELAALAGFSPDHFSRLFKRSFGVSPHQYLLARRVERAKGVVFKQHAGATPGAYRKG